MKIRWRVWDDGKMCYPSDKRGDRLPNAAFALKQNGELIGYFQDKKSGERWWYFGLDVAVVMLATGLKDRNGKEIFEGDVVNVSPDEGNTWDIGTVVYGSYASFCVYLKDVGPGIRSPLLNFCSGTMGIGGADVFIEVIGNIYENPELLKGNENAKMAGK